MFKTAVNRNIRQKKPINRFKLIEMLILDFYLKFSEFQEFLKFFQYYGPKFQVARAISRRVCIFGNSAWDRWFIVISRIVFADGIFDHFVILNSVNF